MKSDQKERINNTSIIYLGSLAGIIAYIIWYKAGTDPYFAFFVTVCITCIIMYTINKRITTHDYFNLSILSSIAMLISTIISTIMLSAEVLKETNNNEQIFKYIWLTLSDRNALFSIVAIYLIAFVFVIIEILVISLFIHLIKKWSIWKSKKEGDS